MCSMCTHPLPQTVSVNSVKKTGFWKVSELWYLSLSLEKVSCKKYLCWSVRLASWLCIKCVNDNSFSKHVKFRFSKQLLAKGITPQKNRSWHLQLSQFVLAGLICCCSKHLKPPQTSWESGCPDYMNSAWQQCCHCVKMSRGPIEGGWVIDMGESTEEIWWHPESSGQSSTLFICYIPQRSVSLTLCLVPTIFSGQGKIYV